MLSSYNLFVNSMQNQKRNIIGVTCRLTFFSLIRICQPTTFGREEFKEMVLALHDAKIAVILDVVYNHVGIPNHLLNIDRELYLMTDELGRLTNHSGCGNDLRC